MAMTDANQRQAYWTITCLTCAVDVARGLGDPPADIGANQDVQRHRATEAVHPGTRQALEHRLVLQTTRRVTEGVCPWLIDGQSER